MKRVDRSVPGQEAPYAKIVKTLLERPDVTYSRNTLWIKRKMFAYCSPKGKLVVKLPKERVQELIKIGQGDPFASGKDKYAPEWLMVGPNNEKNWLPLVEEALKFVASKI